MSKYPSMTYMMEVETFGGTALLYITDTAYDDAGEVKLIAPQIVTDIVKDAFLQSGYSLDGYPVGFTRERPVDLIAALDACKFQGSIVDYEIIGGYIPEPEVADVPQPQEIDDMEDADEGLTDDTDEAAIMEGAKDDIPPTICIDFDGVIADYSKGFQGQDVFGSIMPGAREGILELKSRGWKIIIFSCRPDTPALRKYLADNGIAFDSINVNDQQFEGSNPGKPFADIYLDDRAIRFKSWSQSMTAIIAQTAFAVVLESAKGTGRKHYGGKLVSQKGETEDSKGMQFKYVRLITYGNMGDIESEIYHDDYGFKISAGSLKELKEKMAKHGTGV